VLKALSSDGEEHSLLLMRRGLALLALPIAAALPLGSAAQACMFMAPLEVGDDHRSRAERRRALLQEARRESRERLTRRSAAAQAALASGYDFTGALAEILVPNIRPVPIELPQSCDVANEYDPAGGDEEVEDWLAGTGYEGWADAYRSIAPPWEGETFGPACNAEFRTRFAALLRRRMSEAQRREAYLFLAARIGNWKGGPQPLQPIGQFSVERLGIARLVAFTGGTRRPPIEWLGASSGEPDDIRRWLRATESGRALQATMDDFWSENGALIETPEQACPAALARWPSVQARIVAPIAAAIARNVPPPAPTAPSR
jgi:hypothetical protein